MTYRKKGTTITHRDAQWSDDQYDSDEISLFDLWAILMWRRVQILVTALAVVAVVGGYALLRTQRYQYTTALAVGSYMATRSYGKERAPIEKPEEVLHRLKDVYIPVARDALRKPDGDVPKVAVNARKDSGLLVLHTDASLGGAPLVKALHQHIVDQVLKRHGHLLTPIKLEKQQALDHAKQVLALVQDDRTRNARLEPLQEQLSQAKRDLSALLDAHREQKLDLTHKLEAAKLQLANLKDARNVLESRQARLKDEKGLLSSQLDQSRTLVDQLQSGRTHSAAHVEGAGDAMTLLMIGAQVEQAEQRIDRTQQRLNIDLPAKADEISRKLQNNTRSQKLAGDKISELQTKLANLDSAFQRDRDARQDAVTAAGTALAHEQAKLQDDLSNRQRAVKAAKSAIDEIQPTKAVYVGMRSVRPVGSGRSILVVLGAVLGAMLGVFGAFCTEFVSRANRYLRQMPAIDAGFEVAQEEQKRALGAG